MPKDYVNITCILGIDIDSGHGPELWRCMNSWVIYMGAKENSQPEGCICEQFAYPPKLLVYPNSSDMKELGEIRLGSF